MPSSPLQLVLLRHWRLVAPEERMFLHRFFIKCPPFFSCEIASGLIAYRGRPLVNSGGTLGSMRTGC